MLMKAYLRLAAVFSVIVGGLFVSGLLTGWLLVAAGFAAFGVVFAGMICVLPSVVSHPAPHARGDAARGSRKRARTRHPRPAWTAIDPAFEILRLRKP